MKTEDVRIEERYMIGGLKTAAGKNRTVPIAKKILPLLDVSGEYLIELNGKQLKYRYAYDLLSEHMENLGMDHEFHDTRHTTATLLEKAEVPLLHRKLILGHSSGDVTDRYTHVALEQLVEDIDLI
ncbi:Phage integrase family protein [Butyrivibrio sp. ob235]|nr:Phage integrase family protein [Butyrivibrio sp. ob235]